MNSKSLVAAIVVLAAIVGALAGAWFVLYRQPPAFCEISGRPIHADMLTRVKVDGKLLYACCARCPLTLAANTHQKIEILEVTDYATGRRLRARDAYFVDGSRMEMCSTPRLKFDQERTPYVRLFDRCSPSLLAFRRKEDAQEFIEAYGGTLQRLDDLMRQVEPKQKVTGER
jgi:hypothetical protein